MMFLLFPRSLLSDTAAPFASVVDVDYCCTVLDPLWPLAGILARHLPQMAHVLSPVIHIEYIFGTEGMSMQLCDIDFGHTTEVGYSM